MTKDNTKYIINTIFEEIDKIVKLDPKRIMPGTLYYYSHNGGKFDTKIVLQVLYEIHLENTKEMPTQISDESHIIYQLDIITKYGKCGFRDSLKLLPASVDSIAKNTLGLPSDQGKITINFEDMRNHIAKGTIHINPATGKEDYTSSTPHHIFTEYCIKDTVIIAKALQLFDKKNIEIRGVIVPIKEMITISAISMYITQRKYLNTSTPIIALSPASPVSNFIKKSWFGGRTEVFHSGIGVDQSYHFDVPSMYGRAMCKELPYGNPVHVTLTQTRKDALPMIKALHDNKMIGFFQAEALSPRNNHIPVLGVHHNGKLIFPIGVLRGT